MTAEKWTEVSGWEGFYEVSSFGKIRSVDRVLDSGRRVSGQLMKTRFSRGYWRVNFRRPGVKVSLAVHRLVAEAFIPNPLGLPLVLHWDDDPDNNRLSNLRWGTESDNAVDRVRNGRHNQARKTVCKRGHPFVEANLYFTATGGRQCKTCSLDQTTSGRRVLKESQHGSVTGYRAGCRCPGCVLAKKDSRKKADKF